mgnify:CR=1 FL=1
MAFGPMISGAHLEKVVAKLPDIAAQADVVLGNLEDAIPSDSKEAARAGLDPAQLMAAPVPVSPFRRAVLLDLAVLVARRNGLR